LFCTNLLILVKNLTGANLASMPVAPLLASCQQLQIFHQYFAEYKYKSHNCATCKHSSPLSAMSPLDVL
jgi:hypothetical protein